MMYIIVDNFLQENYKESYSLWKTHTNNTTDSMENNIKDMEEDDYKNY